MDTRPGIPVGAFVDAFSDNFRLELFAEFDFANEIIGPIICKISVQMIESVFGPMTMMDRIHDTGSGKAFAIVGDDPAFQFSITRNGINEVGIVRSVLFPIKNACFRV